MFNSAMPLRLDAEALLTVWERAVGRPPSVRDDVLLQGLANDCASDVPLGERNAMLLGMHARIFGPDLALISHCPGCATVTQFAANCDVMVAELAPAHATTAHELEVQGHRVRFRLPHASDVAASSHASSENEFAESLVARCVQSCTDNGQPVAPSALPSHVLDALSQRMESLDPGASLSFALQCPECSMRWDAQLDAAELLWQKIQTESERLLFDVDTLARAYGWTEAQVLQLSPMRRAAYLQMAMA